MTQDEKELGVAIVDIGSGTTDIAIFEKGSLWHTAVLPIGGEHFTNDVAVALRTRVTEAEKIKKKHGCALVSMVPEEDMIEVPSVGGRSPGSWAASSWPRCCRRAPRRSASWFSPRSAAPASTQR